jgi:anthranilate synthase component 2
LIEVELIAAVLTRYHPAQHRMLLLLDNHDSFTFNLAQYLGELGAEVKVLFADSVTIADVRALRPSHVVLSPGPGTPAEAGISVELVRVLDVPLLGVCLGHQAIARAFGATIVRAPAPVHGKVGLVHHDGRGVFAGLASPLRATRYHSLVVDRRTMPVELEESARSDGDDQIMGLRHRTRPIEGVQFHPESIGTPDGRRLLARFLGRS